MISRSDCVHNTSWAAELLFDLLGVLFAKEGKKATTFDKTFGTLGVTFDLSQITDELFFLSHTESRRSELIETLEDLLRKSIFNPKDIEKLRGRLLWFENFICGRQANILVARLGKFAGGDKRDRPLDDGLKNTLVRLLSRIQAGKAVRVSKKILETWVCCSDGACEETSSIGAVLINPCCRAVFPFWRNPAI